MNMKRITLLTVLTLLCSTAWSAKHIQCWVDNDGRRMCGDSVPPEYSAKERNVFDQQGRIVEHKPRAPTPAEIEQQEKDKAEEAKRVKEAERQHNYDRYLLESYENVHELEQSRDERLKALDVRMEIVQRAIETGQQQLDALLARKQDLQKQGKPIDKNLESQIKDYRRAAIENPKALQQLKIEHEKVTSQFNSDIARYEQLKQASAVQQPPPPPTP